MLRRAVTFLIISILTAVFSFIYELNSHGVRSFFCIYAFLIPLILGFLSYIISFISKRSLPQLTAWFLNALIATLTLGFLYKGVLEIYGTSNIYPYFYWGISAFLALACIISALYNLLSNNKSSRV